MVFTRAVYGGGKKEEKRWTPHTHCRRGVFRATRGSEKKTWRVYEYMYMRLTSSCAGKRARWQQVGGKSEFLYLFFFRLPLGINNGGAHTIQLVQNTPHPLVRVGCVGQKKKLKTKRKNTRSTEIIASLIVSLSEGCDILPKQYVHNTYMSVRTCITPCTFPDFGRAYEWRCELVRGNTGVGKCENFRDKFIGMGSFRL